MLRAVAHTIGKSSVLNGRDLKYTEMGEKKHHDQNICRCATGTGNLKLMGDLPSVA